MFVKKIIPPSFNENIKDFYKGFYDSIYIILNPFIKFKKNDIDVEKMFLSKDFSINRNDLLKYGEIVFWNEFIRLSNIDSLMILNKLLLNSIGAIKTDKLFSDYSEKIEEYSSINLNIMFPNEGIFPEFFEKIFLFSIKDFGYDSFCLNDEFEANEIIIKFKDFDINSNINNLKNNIKSLYSSDCKILYTVHWDSFFTILCSNKKTIDSIVNKYNFEGFYCDNNTTILWHNNMV